MAQPIPLLNQSSSELFVSIPSTPNPLSPNPTHPSRLGQGVGRVAGIASPRNEALEALMPGKGGGNLQLNVMKGLLKACLTKWPDSVSSQSSQSKSAAAKEPAVSYASLQGPRSLKSLCEILAAEISPARTQGQSFHASYLSPKFSEPKSSQ